MMTRERAYAILVQDNLAPTLYAISKELNRFYRNDDDTVVFTTSKTDPESVVEFKHFRELADDLPDYLVLWKTDFIESKFLEISPFDSVQAAKDAADFDISTLLMVAELNQIVKRLSSMTTFKEVQGMISVYGGHLDAYLNRIKEALDIAHSDYLTDSLKEVM